MINWTLPKAITVGICVFIFAQIMYVGVLVKISHYEILRLILLGSPGFAAFVTAYFAPHQKVVTGTFMAIPGTVIAMLAAFGYEYFGLHVDQIGGLMATFVILITYHAALCVVGSFAGYFLSSNRNANL